MPIVKLDSLTVLPCQQKERGLNLTSRAVGSQFVTPQVKENLLFYETLVKASSESHRKLYTNISVYLS
jgi:hypothetical protein